MTDGLALTLEINQGNIQKHATCLGGLTPGGTDLIDLATLSFVGGGGQTDAVLAALGKQFPGDKAKIPWSYSAGTASLGGNLVLDWYKAYDTEKGDRCKHGAQISLHYNRFDGDPLDLRWIQLYTETGGSGNDVNQVDGVGDLDPAYFDATDNPDDYVYVHGTGGLLFGDTPGDGHAEAQPFSGSVSFMAFLASYEDHQITIYEGLTWGYQYRCFSHQDPPIPESGTFGLWGGCFLLVLVGIARRVRPRARDVDVP